MPLGANYRKLFTATTISNLGDGVSVIAYPWLASAITRNPVLIALVAVAQRLPWLLFTLPAGVIVDRGDRRRLMVGANALRAILTFGVAAAVLVRGHGLPGPEQVSDLAGAVPHTDAVLYVALLVATLLLGMGEVIYDNSAQTFMPAIVTPENLERGNGRMYSAEMVANQFVGPPLAGILLAIGFAVPFFVDAGSFAASAWLIFAITGTLAGRSAAPPAEAAVARTSWRTELAEGVRWLWHHPLLRPMAIVLGLMNALGMVAFASIVLWAQEVLDTSATEFAILFAVSAIGGVIGGWLASAVSRRLGSGPSLAFTLVAGALTSLLVGLTTSWLLVAVLLAVNIFAGVLWNVITVSLRQTIIPDRLLGRVNSVYRFFAWGMMPVGSLIGGIVVTVTDQFAGRDLALRMPWFVAAGGYGVLCVFAIPRLTTAKIEAARAEGVAAAAPTTA